MIEFLSDFPYSLAIRYYGDDVHRGSHVYETGASRDKPVKIKKVKNQKGALDAPSKEKIPKSE